MQEFKVSTEQVNDFLEDGFLIIPNLLDSEETELLLAAANADPMMKENVFDVSDRKGKNSQMTLWNHPGDDLWGMVSRSNRIVESMEKILDGEVYHYHSKLILKKPTEGGAWEWHQANTDQWNEARGNEESARLRLAPHLDGLQERVEAVRRVEPSRRRENTR